MPVESLTGGERIVLPRGKVVVVQHVDRYPTASGDVLYVRWAAGPRLRPPHRLAGEPAELGSLVQMRPGDLVYTEST